jgi:ABC-type transport system substrate-binding protein
MQKMKWIFFGYLAFVGLVIAGIAVGFEAAPPRDPHTYYATTGAVLKTLDPAEVGDTEGSDILGYMCEGLYNYKYKVHPYEIYPELAESMPEVSPDGLTMTIKVRPGIHYYDYHKVVWPDGVGPEVTAADFVYSFKRVCDFHLASPNYSFVFQDHFVGLDDWWDYTKKTPAEQMDFDRPVEGFKALDARTLQLKFTKPYPQMIYNLVNCPTFPVSREIVKYYGKNVRLHPVGTGPYALDENLREQRMTLVANPVYRGRPDVDGNAVVPETEKMPHIKRVELDYFSEEMPVWLLFQQGLFDVEGIPKDAFGQAVAGGNLTPAMTDKGIVLHKYAESSTAYIGFNMKDPVLGKNKPLRQAMSLAFNRAAYIRIFLNGRGVPGIGPIPPGFPTFDPKRVNPYSQYNLAEAKKLMVEAERINGGPIPPLSILYRGTDTSERQTADFTVSQMKEIGVTLVPDLEDFARWQDMLDNRQTQVFDAGWDADYPDEQDYMQLFYGKNADAGGLNANCYVNPEFDALYDKAAVLNDTPERRDLYMKMEHIIEEDCPWITVDYSLLYQLQYDWISNRERMMYGHGYLAHYEMDEALRAKRLAGQK